MMTGLLQDQNLEKQIEKQIGCMSGFLHIFDRQQILAGKRIYSTKRLPPSTGNVSVSPEVKKHVDSTSASRELEKPVPVVVAPESPDRFQPSTPPKSPLPLPLFEPKEGAMKSSWKFCKEMPRLSLDSRATVDSKGRICRNNGGSSPSVIAKLMGLDQLPSSDSSSPETVKTPELRRSASESRVSRDLFQSRFIDGNNFQAKQPYQARKESTETNLANNSYVRDNVESVKYTSRNVKSESPATSPWRSRSPHQRRSFFDSTDFFPDSKPKTVPMYADLEKSLRIKGMDEQSKDLDTLKQILEALQLKGLLHSKRPVNRDSNRNFVYDRSLASEDSKIFLMKPWLSPASNRRLAGESLPSMSPRKERGVLDRSGRSPVRTRNSSPPIRTESNSRYCNSIVKRQPLSIETQRSVRESSESRRNSPINSPKLTTRRSGSDQHSVTNRSPRNSKPANMVYSKEKFFKNIVLEDESSSISESTGSTSSQTDPERSKIEEYREGKNLLQRCDKLLHSIAEMNSVNESQPSSASVLPSPVSVLDSAFDKDESSSPSPVMKRNIDFKDLTVDSEDDIWFLRPDLISPAISTKEKEFISDDSDFIYISEILQASKYLPEDSNLFFFLEKQQLRTGNNNSKASKLNRKLIFDIIAEIVDRNRNLPPWNVVSLTESNDSVKQIWIEFQKIRERETADNLLDLICGVLKRDLAGINGDFPVELSESVLDIERLIFKDLVSETIRDLAELAAKSKFLAPRRKLVF